MNGPEAEKELTERIVQGRIEKTEEEPLVITQTKTASLAIISGVSLNFTAG